MTANVLIPRVGDLVLTFEGPGHTAVIIKIEGDVLTIKEANYNHCQVTTRTLNIHDIKIRGFKRVIK